MKLLCLLIIIMVVLLILKINKKVRYNCGLFRTPMGIANVCVQREDFNIPMKPTALCEARCETDLDHAELLEKGILAKSCIMNCNQI